jgi:predicted ester cyclase
MSADQNKTFVQRFYDEFWGRPNIAAADKFCSTSYKFHLGRMLELPNLDAFKQFFSGWFSGFPDFSCPVSEPMIAESDRVVTRYAWSGTHTAASPAVFNGLPPTGKKVTVTGITIDRLADGKIVETWCEEDVMGLAQQLGVVPPMG